MGIFNEIGKTARLGIDKITSDKERLEGANNLITATKEVDMMNISVAGNFNIKNTRSWLELICVTAFGYSNLLVPIANDLLAAHLHGVGDGVDSLLYAMFGLGGYRLANKVIKK